VISLTDTDYVKGLKGNIRASLETDSGKEVIKFLEVLCGWYDFSESDPNKVLISHGKRQVLATIKTLIDLTAEEIVAVAKSKEQ
jgi:iron only hydrogenase large subunit-like protein